MFTCPLHQWASHELPCPACKNQSGITSSNSVLINPDGYVEPSPAAPPPDHRTAKAIQQPNGSYNLEYTEGKDEGQEELWREVVNPICDWANKPNGIGDINSLVDSLMQQFHITKKK